MPGEASYGPSTVCALRAGEVVGIVGRNGVGKTTLVTTIAGLLPPTAGRIRFKDEDVTRRDAHDRARRGMGYVPQGCGIFPRLRVIENLRTGEGLGSQSDAAHYDHVFEWFPRLKERLRQGTGTL